MPALPLPCRCGNTLNCNHPVVRQFILDALKYWVTEMHVDGFRCAALRRAAPRCPALRLPPAGPALQAWSLWRSVAALLLCAG